MRAKAFIMSLLCIVAIFAGAEVATASPGVSIMDVRGMDEGVLPGEVAIYTVEVKSITDQTEHAVFNLENPLPGWSYEFNPQGFDISPDETEYAYFNVTVPENTTPGTYPHKINLVAQAITVPPGKEETSYILLLVVKSTPPPSPLPSPAPSPTPSPALSPTSITSSTLSSSLTPPPTTTTSQTPTPFPSPTPSPSPSPAPASTPMTPSSLTPAPTQIPSSTCSPTPSTPGFEVVLAITGLIVIAYFIFKIRSCRRF